MMSTFPRTINPFVQDDGEHGKQRSVSLDPSRLPIQYDVIPAAADGLGECAVYQIRRLERLAQSDSCHLLPEEEDALDDGFFICDLSVIERKLEAWRQMFPRIKPFFALKCNPDAMVAAVLGQYSFDVGFDCASVAEINLALKSTGGEVRRCIYANPQRAEEDLFAALSLGVEALTFDGAEELRKVKMAHEARMKVHEKETVQPKCMIENVGRSSAPMPPEVILRILVPDANSSVPLGEKFGAKPTDVGALAELAIDLELPLIGVSFHCGSGCHDPEAYGAAIRLAKEAIDVINDTKQMRMARDGVESCVYQKCCLLDIGGGYPGLDGGRGDMARFCGNDFVSASQSALVTVEDLHGQETASKIAAVVSPLVDNLFPSGKSGVSVISEPGRYFVESAFALCSRIYCSQCDAQGRRHYYIAQGVQGVFKDALLCGEKFYPIPLRCGSRTSEKGYSNEDHGNKLFLSTVHGPSGDSFDVVCADYHLPPLEPGDWLIFDRMGAYTLSIAAKCGQLPVRYMRRA